MPILILLLIRRPAASSGSQSKCYYDSFLPAGDDRHSLLLHIINYQRFCLSFQRLYLHYSRSRLSNDLDIPLHVTIYDHP